MDSADLEVIRPFARWLEHGYRARRCVTKVLVHKLAFIG